MKDKKLRLNRKIFPLGIPGDSDLYSRPYSVFILRKKYSKPYIQCEHRV
jgi:hypothetical protein